MDGPEPPDTRRDAAAEQAAAGSPAAGSIATSAVGSAGADTVASAPVAPLDPRTGWNLPSFGAMPVVAHLDEVATRVLAPNPSPMTLDGTNTYVLGGDGTGEVLVVDPGPDDPDHLARVRQVVAARDAEVRAIVVTHHHLDHAAAAAAWAAGFGCEVVASTREVAGPLGRVVADGDTIALAGLDVEVVATPGHTRDHIAIRLGTGVLLTGDHVLGRGTSVVAHPDGDLVAYLDSLRRVLDLGPHACYPGHGPELTEDPSAVVTFYLEHRAFREQQLLAALARGPATPGQLVAQVYADVDRQLWPAAEASTRAALAALVERAVITHGADDVAAVAVS
jgi:glyoxylase-like metal-dependent hydrolase (beta-lactamase superfamily II)